MSLSKAQIKEIVGYAATIIYANEGSYGSVNKNDNGAVSIGKVQWHGNRALSLIKTICTADISQAKGILSNMFLNEIVSASPRAWTERVVTSTEASEISALLVTTTGRLAQDNLADADITSYINKGISYGLTDYGALIYFADGANQYGTVSELWKSIAEKALSGLGDVDAMYAATKVLTSNHLDRRTKVYKAILALNLKTVGNYLNKQEVSNVELSSRGLAEYAIKCLALKTRYMWGSFGQSITELLINQKKVQYPNEYPPIRVDTLKALVGKDYHGFDCIGLIKSYLWGGYNNLKYNSAQDKSANAMQSLATARGDINTIPEIPGLCVWMDGHVGVYIGSGYVIESTQNVKFGDGVCKTILTDRKWIKWFSCPFINDDIGCKTVITDATYNVKTGDTLWAIAVKYLGKGTRYTEIKMLNGLNSDVIKPGQMLKIPAK